MNGKLVTRVEKLEAANGGVKAIRYVWVGLDETVDAALAKARTEWPHHELHTIRWLRPGETPDAA